MMNSSGRKGSGIEPFLGKFKCIKADDNVEEVLKVSITSRYSKNMCMNQCFLR